MPNDYQNSAIIGLEHLELLPIEVFNFTLLHYLEFHGFRVIYCWRFDGRTADGQPIILYTNLIGVQVLMEFEDFRTHFEFVS